MLEEQNQALEASAKSLEAELNKMKDAHRKERRQTRFIPKGSSLQPDTSLEDKLLDTGDELAKQEQLTLKAEFEVKQLKQKLDETKQTLKKQRDDAEKFHDLFERKEKHLVEAERRIKGSYLNFIEFHHSSLCFRT